MKAHNINYKGTFLGSSKDLAGHQLNAYRVLDEIHLVYENGYTAVEKIEHVLSNLDDFLWTPYAEYVFGAEKCLIE